MNNNNNNNNNNNGAKSPPFLKREKAFVQHSRQKSQPRQGKGVLFASFRIQSQAKPKYLYYYYYYYYV